MSKQTEWPPDGVELNKCGIHQNRTRPRDGYIATAKPEEHPGRGIRRARKRLANRLANFDSQKPKSGYRRPGSLKK